MVNQFMQWACLKLEKWCENTNRYKIIYNNHPNEDKVYLIRYFVFTCPFFHVYLHRFMMSDLSVPHDHPFSFLGYIVSGEYEEETLLLPNVLQKKMSKPGVVDMEGQTFPGEVFTTTKQKRTQGSWAYRPQHHSHVVHISKEYRLKERHHAPFTMIIRGPYRKNWGFWEETKHGNRKWTYSESYLSGTTIPQNKNPKDTEIEGVQ